MKQGYKDSGIEWIGEIPENWGVTKLRNIADVKYGITLQLEQGKTEGIPIISVQNVTINGGLDFSSNFFIDEELVSKDDILQQNDILFNWRNGSTEHVGKTVLFTLNDKYTHVSFLLRLRVKKIFSPLYLNWLISSLRYNKFFLISKFKVNNSYNASELNRTQIISPPLSEQKQIAAYLDKATETIDKAIAVKKEQLQKLDELKKSIIYKAVTKGLDDSVKMKDSGIEWIGDIPEGWEVKRIKDISLIKYGLGQPPKELDVEDGGLPLIRATNVYRGSIDSRNMIFVDPEDIPFDRDPILMENDIIVVRSGAYTADSAIIPKEYEGSITGYDMVIRCFSYINPEFVSYALLSKYIHDDQLRLMTLRAAQPHLNREELGSTRILIPSKAEQIEISKYIKKKTKDIKSASEKITQQIEILEQYKKSLIHECVTGKRRVG